jgi:ubiquinone/menaquinone biosynthesis C-methylase UbiE
MNDPPKLPAVKEKVYNKVYFVNHCGGADWLEQFIQTDAKEIYPIYVRITERLRPTPNERVLDIGCGRGEIVALLALKGLRAVGLDYSVAALEIASAIRDVFVTKYGTVFSLVRADATALPFPARYFDHIVLSDVVEHLHNWQLTTLYSECWRVLRPFGSLIVHTWPNVWHTRYTYPIVARISRLLGIPRPFNHRKPHDEIMHVNEQTPRSLRFGLQKANFKINSTWCEHEAVFSWHPHSLFYWLIHRTPGLRLFFADHLWVLAIKDEY